MDEKKAKGLKEEEEKKKGQEKNSYARSEFETSIEISHHKNGVLSPMVFFFFLSSFHIQRWWKQLLSPEYQMAYL